MTATPTSASSAPAGKQEDDPVAIAIERAINRATVAEEKVALYEEKLQAKDDRIAAKDAELEAVKQQRDFYKSASSDRRDVSNIDAQRLADARQMLAEANAEIQRLRHPGLLASIFDTRTLTGAVAGYAGCKLTSGGTSNPFQQFVPASNSYPLFAYRQKDQSVLFQPRDSDKLRKALEQMRPQPSIAQRQ